MTPNLSPRRRPLVARNLALLFVAVVLPLAVFGKLGREVWEKEGFSFDLPILQTVHRYSSPGLDRAMVVVSDAGFPWGSVPIAVGVLLLLLVKRQRSDASFLSTAVLGASAIDLIAKRFFGRPRPDFWVSPAPDFDSGFPSGHSMFSLAVVTALIILLWRTRWRWPVLAAGLLFTLAVGYSRVYLGVHYPSDVLAAWAASLAWVLGVGTLFYGRPLLELKADGSTRP